MTLENICYFKTIVEEDNWIELKLTDIQKKCVYECDGHDVKCGTYTAENISFCDNLLSRSF